MLVIVSTEADGFAAVIFFGCRTAARVLAQRCAEAVGLPVGVLVASAPPNDDTALTGMRRLRQ